MTQLTAAVTVLVVVVGVNYVKKRTQHDNDMTSCWHTLFPQQCQAHPGLSPTLCELPHIMPLTKPAPHTHTPPHLLPSLCCFVLSLWKIMKASTCNCGSIDVRIHNQQIQKHILGSKLKKKKRGGRGGCGVACKRRREGGGGSVLLAMKLWAQRGLGCRAHLLRLWGK